MSGSTFSSKGTAGLAPQTVWMSPLADRLTIMLAVTETPLGGNSYNTVIAPYVPPLLANQAVNYNCSFGATTTAPDGTTNAQHITEDSSTGNHYITGAFRCFSGFEFIYHRMAGIYKADTRTRICFEVNDLSGSLAYVGFDLAGGQIAYGPSVASAIIPINAFIYPLRGFPGWYLCIFDAYATQALAQDLFFRTYLDNGSGTAARSISYAGNSVAGVYGWKTSVLPVGAWAISSTSLFNDFTNLNRVDVNNTKNPGYDLYFQCETWTNWQWEGNSLVSAIPPPGTLTIVNGTELSCPPFGRGMAPIPFTYQYSLGFASETNGQVSAPWPQRGPVGSPPGSYVGHGYAPPYCWEYKIRMLLSHQGADGSEWDHSSMRLPQLVAAAKDNNKYINGGDMDTMDAVSYKDNGTHPQSGSECLYQSFGQIFNVGQHGIATGSGSATFGCFPVYTSNISTLNNSGIAGGPYASGGLFYKNANTSTSSGPPGAPWTAYTYGQTTVSGGFTSLDQPPVVIDFENTGQVFTCLHTPYNPLTGEPGVALGFHNGCYTHVMCNGYSPVSVINPYHHTTDWEEINRFFYFPSLASSGFYCYIDWIRMMQ